MSHQIKSDFGKRIPLCNVCGKPANNWSVGVLYTRGNSNLGIREYRPKDGAGYFRCDKHAGNDVIEIDLGIDAPWPAGEKETK